jgi:hypothetical protein
MVGGVGFTEGERVAVQIGATTEFNLADMGTYRLNFYPKPWIKRLDILLWEPVVAPVTTIGNEESALDLGDGSYLVSSDAGIPILL